MCSKNGHLSIVGEGRQSAGSCEVSGVKCQDVIGCFMDTLFELPEITKANHRIRMMSGARQNRIAHDFYPTPEIATVKFLERETFDGEIWEPACGDGAMSSVIERYGYRVKSTDLIYRGYGEGGINFLRCNHQTDNIVTNPPFKLANKFIHHALEHAKNKVALLLRLNMLESKSRKKLFTEYPFARLYIHSERIPFKVKATTGSNAIAFAWFVWDFSYSGKPVIEFL